MKRKYHKPERKAFAVLTGNQGNSKDVDSNVLLFKTHFCIISRSGGRTWYPVRTTTGTAA
ncbi:MAG: hypothetical protein C5B53_06645 [Candidatus Melainabacteria bacterium]|nr:MAG: hypothetical protein C5B53_06645 [Candidatus Melainabacteria bacterium]